MAECRIHRAPFNARLPSSGRTLKRIAVYARILTAYPALRVEDFLAVQDSFVAEEQEMFLELRRVFQTWKNEKRRWRARLIRRAARYGSGRRHRCEAGVRAMDEPLESDQVSATQPRRAGVGLRFTVSAAKAVAEAQPQALAVQREDRRH